MASSDIFRQAASKFLSKTLQEYVFSRLSVNSLVRNRRCQRRVVQLLRPKIIGGSFTIVSNAEKLALNEGAEEIADEKSALQKAGQRVAG